MEGAVVSDSRLISYTRISPNSSARRHKIDTVTVHCTDGHMTVEQLGALFARPSRRASSNYGIGDDGRIGLYVPEGRRAWTTGGDLTVNGISGSDNDHRAVTIEVSSDHGAPHAVTREALDALVLLLADICQRNGIDRLRWEGDRSLVGDLSRQNMTAHRWFSSSRSCPGNYLFARMGKIAQAVNEILEAAERPPEDEVTQEQFNWMMAAWIAEQKKKPVQPYAEEALAWAKESGVMAGDKTGNQMPQAFTTREDTVVTLWRALKQAGLID